MEELQPSREFKPRSLAEIELPTGSAPVSHTVRFLDPRDVAAHFAALEVTARSAEERWAKKRDATPFPGV